MLSKFLLNAADLPIRPVRPGSGSYTPGISHGGSTWSCVEQGHSDYWLPVKIWFSAFGAGKPSSVGSARPVLALALASVIQCGK